MRRFWHDRRAVSFDENVLVRERGRTDARGEEAEEKSDVFSPERRMVSVENLLRDVCPRRPLTVVYGNLGRRARLLRHYLRLIYGRVRRPRVAVRARGLGVREAAEVGAEASSSPDVARLQEDYPDDGRDLDVLFWLEPEFDAEASWVPRRTKSLVILTSHLNFDPAAVGSCAVPHVVSFHVGDATVLDRNSGRAPPPPPLSRYVDAADRRDRFDEDGGGPVPTFVPHAFVGRRVRLVDRDAGGEDGGGGGETVRADLGDCDSPSEAYLRLLNARDALRHSRGSYRGWSAVLKEDVRVRLMKQLARLKETLLSEVGKIPCNLNGVDVMVEEYVDPFLMCPP